MATTQQRKLPSPGGKCGTRRSISGSPKNKAPPGRPPSPGAVGHEPAAGWPLCGHSLWCRQQAQWQEASQSLRPSVHPKLGLLRTGLQSKVVLYLPRRRRKRMETKRQTHGEKSSALGGGGPQLIPEGQQPRAAYTPTSAALKREGPGQGSVGWSVTTYLDWAQT